MTPEERMHAAEVDRYWDAWVLTGHPLRTDSVDPDTRELIDRLWAVGVPPQAAEARKRVWQRLRHASEQEEDPMDITTATDVRSLTHWSPSHPNGRIDSGPSPLSIRPWWRGVSGPVVTAALVMLVLSAGLFAAGPLRPNREATTPVGISAVMTAPATPGPKEAIREVLVETTVPAEDLPTAEDRYFHISQATIQPDVVVTSPAELVACCPGPLVDHVLMGELTVRVEGPLRVARAGTAATPGSVEEVAPGTDVVLRAGDTALYDQASPTEYANRGTEPVQLVGGGLFVGRPLVPPPGLILNNFDSIDSVPSISAGPATFVLERVTLPPSATLPGSPDGALRVVTSGPQVAYLPKAADGSVTNLVLEPIEAYALTLIPAGSEFEPAETTPRA
jgi:hypothetical protein